MYSDYFAEGDAGGLTNPYSPAPAQLAVGRRGPSALAPRLAALGVFGAGLTAGLAGADLGTAAPVTAAPHLHVVDDPVAVFERADESGGRHRA